MADQLAPHFTGAYGHPLVRTPAMDALAERGTRFDAAYCHVPLCAPSRFSMLASRQATAIDAWDNAAEFPARVPTMAHYLNLAGSGSCLPAGLPPRSNRRTSSRYSSRLACATFVGCPRIHGQPPVQRASITSPKLGSPSAATTGSPSRIAPSYTSPLDVPDSKKDMGRSRVRAMRPAPEWWSTIIGTRRIRSNSRPGTARADAQLHDGLGENGSPGGDHEAGEDQH